MSLFIDIFKSGMCVRNFVKISSLLTVIAVFCACGEMADILPSTGTYKVSAKVNNLNIDDCSLISPNDNILPYFEESVTKDPDLTALVIFLRDSQGEITGVKATYDLNENHVSLGSGDDLNKAEDDQENQGATGEKEGAASAKTSKKKVYKNGDELFFTVSSFDKNLPSYPLVEDLPIGRYSIVYQVMGGKQILQKTEKPFFYLGNASFSFKDIQVHLPGVADNALNISTETVIMLEAKLEHDARFDPYIVWYNGKSIISEGKFANGAGNFLWKAPDQSGFFSLRAEVYPVSNRYGLSGYTRDISLLISSNLSDLHLLSENTPGLVHWYVLDGNLNDSKKGASAEWALKPEEKTLPKWKPANGLYALSAETGDIYSLKEIPFSNKEINDWRILFRFKPVKKADYLSVTFGPSFDVSMTLSADEKNLVLTLASPKETVAQTLELPSPELFFTAVIDFSMSSNKLSAGLFINYQNNLDSLSNTKTISLNVDVNKEYRIVLGNRGKNKTENETEENTEQKPELLALLDELAVINKLLVEENNNAEKDPPQTAGLTEPRSDSALEI